MIKLSDYVFQFLKDKEVSEVFMLPGGGAMHLVDSLGKSDVNYTCFAHEQGASIAAEAYGQHTNEIGVLLVTSGPGVTNAITGVTGGYFDSTPMFVVSGQAKSKDLVADSGLRTRGSQEVQTIEMVAPITKYAIEVLDPNSIRYHLERAYHEATTGRKGPVWISIPLDIQAMLIDPTDLDGFVAQDDHFCNLDNELQLSNKLLKNSQKPLIIAGNGIKLSAAQEEFELLKEKWNIPVITTWKTIDLLDENDPHYIGHPGIMGDRATNLIIQESDLILVLGSRLDPSITAFDDSNFGKNAKVILVDLDISEINKIDRTLDLAVVSDIKPYINGLLKLYVKKNKKGNLWLEYCKNIKSIHPVVTAYHRDSIEEVSAYYFTDRLCDKLTSTDIIVPESSGGAGEITYQAFKVKKGQKIKNAAALGSMGFGLPYSIGACLANNKKRTILINGDGAFALNIQELETLKRLNLPVKIFILNNNGYASIKAMQDNNFDGNHVASSDESGFTLPEVTSIAVAYGLKTFSARTNTEMEAILDDVLNSDGPVLCELHTKPTEAVSPRVKTIIHEDGSITSGQLENMWPFLDE